MTLIKLACASGFAGYLLLLIISPLLLSVPGDRIPVFAWMICLGVLPALSPNLKYRGLAIVMVLFAATFIIVDYQRGQEFQAKQRIVHNGHDQNRHDSTPQSHSTPDMATWTRPAYFLWLVGGLVDHGSFTSTHELGHWLGLRDEYWDPLLYPWHIAPSDSSHALMTCKGWDVL